MTPSTRRCLLLFLTIPFILGGSLLVGASGFGWPDGDSAAGRMILTLRVSRVVGGFFVGAALACAGVVFQAILRNPLADPYVLGVSSGAGLGAAVAILTGLAATHTLAIPVVAFISAALTLILVYALASDGGRPSVYGLILSGVIVSSICSSLLMFLVATAPAQGLHNIIWWMLGNLQPSHTGMLIASSGVIAVGIGVIGWLAPDLNALTLGHEAAHHIGVRTTFAVLMGLGASTLISAAAVGLAGLIGFVGLMVPHATRAVIGPDHRRLIPAAAVAGGLFLVVCDSVARTVLTPIEIPVGVLTALGGGPFFLIILRRQRKGGWME